MLARLLATAILFLPVSSVALEFTTQWDAIGGKVLVDFLREGYEIKAAAYKGNINDYDLFLQKGTDAVMCRDSMTYIGNTLTSVVQTCFRIVAPHSPKKN